MSAASFPTSSATRTGMLVVLFAASILVTFGVILGLRGVGVIADPETLTAQKVVRELNVRLTLLLFFGCSYAAILSHAPTRDWVLAQRWRVLMLTLFALGAATSMADPFHPVTAEQNWIRYWTAGALLVGGLFAVYNATRNVHPLPDRLFGGALGSLLLVAACDEILQFHEQAGAAIAAVSPLKGTLQANDLFTLLVAIVGMLVLGVLILIRSYGGRLGRLLRRPRYRRPIQLFSLAVFAFLGATMLDSFDIYLQAAVDSLSNALKGAPSANPDHLWLALADVRELANAVEEMLELLSALSLLMTIGSLFSIDALGAEKSGVPG